MVVEIEVDELIRLLCGEINDSRQGGSVRTQENNLMQFTRPRTILPGYGSHPPPPAAKYAYIQRVLLHTQNNIKKSKAGSYQGQTKCLFGSLFAIIAEKGSLRGSLGGLLSIRHHY